MPAAPEPALEQRSTVVLTFNSFDELRRKAAVKSVTAPAFW
jgi:hypothetical protein